MNLTMCMVTAKPSSTHVRLNVIYDEMHSLIVILFQSFSSLNKTEDERVCSFYEPIDVVFTWVNGSDPEFIKNLNQYFPNSDYQPSRYQGL